VNVVTALSEGKAKFVPDVLVAGGGNGGAIEGLAATAMRFFGNGGNGASHAAVTPAVSVTEVVTTEPPKNKPSKT
jgi:hypothetical protein